MIRNIVTMRIRPGTAPEQVDALLSALLAVTFPGCTSYVAGRDLGLREGNVDIGIVADFEDEAAYRAYDANEEHNRIRRELMTPIVESTARCQVLVQGPVSS